MCDVCGDFGFYRLDLPFGHPNFGKLVRCSCKDRDDAERLQKLSGLTNTERMQTLDMIETGDRPGTLEMVRRCKAFIERPSTTMTIWGGTGNAKSMALQAVVNHFVGINIEAVYITAFDLIAHIRAAFFKEKGNDLSINSMNAYQRLQQFERVKILAVDEFDKINVTDWVREQLTDLIDRRYRLAQDEQAGTLIAMNDDPRNQPAWIYSRLAQGTIVCNSDTDMRPLFGQMQLIDPRTHEVIE